VLIHCWIPLTSVSSDVPGVILLFRLCSGINVLDNKTELRKEMEKRKQRQQQREDDEQQRQNRSCFERRLEQQANKLDLVTAPVCNIDTKM